MNTKSFIADPQANLTTIRDPMVVTVGNTYYLTGTQPPYWKGENAGVHLWSSEDLVHFTDHGLILRREDLPASAWCRDRFWAPELFVFGEGKYLLTFNCRNESTGHPHNTGLARAKDITGPYEILTKDHPLPHPLETCNDATMFRDDDGSLWMGFNNTAARLLLHRFDPETLILSDPQEVAVKGEEGQWDSIGVEGQCIVKRHGIYFQWYSSWTHGYNAGILTASSIRGPWKKACENPILGDCADFHHAGHNHAFRAPDGKDYIIFHACSTAEEGFIERMFIREVRYLPSGQVELVQD